MQVLDEKEFGRLTGSGRPCGHCDFSLYYGLLEARTGRRWSLAETARLMEQHRGLQKPDNGESGQA